MAQLQNYIVNVLSITAASPGLVLTEGGSRVVALALVAVTSSVMPGSMQEQRIIPLTELDFGYDLLGREVTDKNSMVEFSD